MRAVLPSAIVRQIPTRFRPAGDCGYGVGSLVGERYLLLERIGCGSSAIVFRARELEARLDVAVKIALPNSEYGHLVADLFTKEATALKRLGNAHGVAELVGIEASDKRPYLVTMYINGSSLGASMAALKGLRRCVELVHDLCLALEGIHAAGVVHRDLKPKNIMVLPQRLGGWIKVIDFGSAKVCGLDSPGLRGGGNPIYLSPEQRRDNGECDHRADIFAAGIILLEGTISNITGCLSLGTAMAIAEQCYRVSRLMKTARGVPRKLTEVIECATEPNPDNRFRDASEMRMALEGALIALEQN